MQETWVRSLGWEDPLEEGMETHSSILAWRTHEQRSLAVYSPWGRKESDRTEVTYTQVTHTSTQKLSVSNFSVRWAGGA